MKLSRGRLVPFVILVVVCALGSGSLAGERVGQDCLYFDVPVQEGDGYEIRETLAPPRIECVFGETSRTLREVKVGPALVMLGVAGIALLLLARSSRQPAVLVGYLALSALAGLGAAGGANLIGAHMIGVLYVGAIGGTFLALLMSRAASSDQTAPPNMLLAIVAGIASSAAVALALLGEVGIRVPLGGLVTGVVTGLTLVGLTRGVVHLSRVRNSP
jgi:hypothetical protein